MNSRWDKTRRLFQRTLQTVLKPEPKLTVSQWAEQYRELDASSNIQGRWSNDATPYLVEIMDCLNDPVVREIYFCKASQIGGTEALINMLSYVITMAPGPSMIVYPTDDLAKEVSNNRLRPAFRTTKEVRRLFRETKSKELELKFAAMTLFLNGANSPSKLASRPIKYLFFDEIDKMPGASKKEASPYNLAKERTKTYISQRKIYACSTPTLRNNYIWNLHSNCEEVRHYFVPCPQCGAMIELKFKQIIFAKDDEKTMSVEERAKTAVYVCQECGCEIKDAEKPRMLREGRWIAVRKRGIGKPKSVGFWINSLYSTFLKWSDIAEEFLKDKDDPEELQNFTNSWLGEPWEETKLKTSEDTVMERQTDFPEFMVPPWTKFITAGVDVQETSLYYVIRAWGEFTTSQLITHGQVLHFADIEEIMNREFETEDGRRMVVRLAFIDSGWQPDATYDFCLNNSDWALPVKGSSNPMQSRYKISKINKEGSMAYGMQLIMVDGGQFKDSIASRMRRPNGNGSWMVYQGIDEEYCKQVTSEHKVSERQANGQVRLVWKEKHSHADNHYLDCEVYAMAAAEMCGVRSLHLQGEKQEAPKPAPREERTEEEQWIQANEGWLGGIDGRN